MSFDEIEDFYTYRKDHNTFAVSFLNENELSVFDVKNIFKVFGDINVVQSKSPNGYCFVNFRNEEDARRCIKCMKNHQFIKLSRPKKRDPLPRLNINQIRDNDSLNVIKTSNVSDRLKIRAQSDNNNNEKIIEEEKLLKVFNNKIVDESPSGTENKHVAAAVYTVQENKKEKDEEKTSIRDCDDELKSDTCSITNISKHLSQFYLTEINNMSGSDSTEPVSSSDSEYLKKIKNNLSMVPSNLIKNADDLVENFDILYPNKSCSLMENLSEADESTEIIEAQDVIIADIPEELGTISILHYLEAFRPIVISSIKRTATIPSVRYCHVYFPTIQDAQNVEKYFDGRFIGKRRIIALRPDSLAHEASLLSV